MPEQLWKSPWRRWTQTVGTLPLRGGGSACRKSVHVKNTRGPASPLRPKTKTAPDRLQCEPEPEYGTRISASVHSGWFELAASGADVGAGVRSRLIPRRSEASAHPGTRWHAFRRGLATNLHQLGVFDKTIQRILRHANVAVTQNCYIKTADSEVAAAMQQFEQSLEYAPNMHLSGTERTHLM